MSDHAKRARLFEPGFEYVPHDRTNIRERFDRVREELKRAEPPPKSSTVRPLRRSKP